MYELRGPRYSKEEQVVIERVAKQSIGTQIPGSVMEEIVVDVNKIITNMGLPARTPLAIANKVYGVKRKMERKIANKVNKGKAPRKCLAKESPMLPSSSTNPLAQLDTFIDLLKEVMIPIITENERLKQQITNLKEIKEVVERYKTR